MKVSNNLKPGDRTINLFGVKFYNFTFEEALEEITGLIDKKVKTVAFTPNVDHIVKILRNNEIKKLYEAADLILNDSRVLYIASRFLRNRLRGKISGSDILPVLCKISSTRGYKIFFLGGRDNAAYQAAEHFRLIYKAINITGIISPEFGFENREVENDKIINTVNLEKPDILFVGLGMPKQEKWLIENKDRLDVTFMIGVGASFEFASGMIRRSPKWVQFLALEWFYRLIKEPRRLWKRYFTGNTLFFLFFIREFFRSFLKKSVTDS